jgi:hypothetical protein
LKLSLNGNFYWTPAEPERGAIVPYMVQPQSNAIRTVGTQRRIDNKKINRYPHQGFPLGVGWSRMDRETGRGVGGLRDSTCETRFRTVELSINNVSQTHADPAQHPKGYLNAFGDLWCAFEEDYASGEATSSFARKFASNAYSGGGSISDAGNNDQGRRVFDLVHWEQRMYALVNGIDGSSTANEELVYKIYSSLDGATWTEETGANFPDTPASNRYIPTSITRRNNFDDDMGKLVSFGGTLLAAVWRHPSSTDGDGLIEVLSKTDNSVAGAWTSHATLASGDGPKAFVVWRDPTNLAVTVPVVITAENIWKVDVSGNAVIALLPAGVLTGDPNDGRDAHVGLDGNLYVPLGSGEILCIQVAETNQIVVTFVGPPGDGLVTARQGHVNAIVAPPGPWLFVSYGGHAADKTAGIWAIEYRWQQDPQTGKHFRAWHHLYIESDDDIDIYLMGFSAAPDASPRLHFALEHATDAEMFVMGNPLISAKGTGTAQQKQTSGFIRLPTDDLGDPQSSAAVLQALVDADDLDASTSGEYIKLEDGLDGDADTTNDRGDFLSGDKDLTYGTSNRGVSAKTIASRLTLHRSGGAGGVASPALYEFEIQARNKLTVLRGWQVPIDLELTAAERGDIRVVDVQAELDAIMDSVTLLPLIFIDQSTTEHEVEVVQHGPSAFVAQVDPGTIEAGDHSGLVTLWLEEVIDV